MIIDPRGEVTTGPAKGEAILLATCSQEALLAAKSVIDVGGHYSRPDLFQLRVNDQTWPRVRGREANWMTPVRGLMGGVRASQLGANDAVDGQPPFGLHAEAHS